MVRRGNTGKEIVDSGEFYRLAMKKGGKPQYEHISGAIISYDCMAWGWRIDGGSECWPALWTAVLMLRDRLQTAA